MSNQMLVSWKGLSAIVAENVERTSHLVNLDVVTIQNQGRRETEVTRLTQGPEQGKKKQTIKSRPLTCIIIEIRGEQ